MYAAFAACFESVWLPEQAVVFIVRPAERGLCRSFLFPARTSLTGQRCITFCGIKNAKFTVQKYEHIINFYLMGNFSLNMEKYFQPRIIILSRSSAADDKNKTRHFAPQFPVNKIALICTASGYHTEKKKLPCNSGRGIA